MTRVPPWTTVVGRLGMLLTLDGGDMRYQNPILAREVAEECMQALYRQQLTFPRGRVLRGVGLKRGRTLRVEAQSLPNYPQEFSAPFVATTRRVERSIPGVWLSDGKQMWVGVGTVTPGAAPLLYQLCADMKFVAGSVTGGQINVVFMPSSEVREYRNRLRKGEV